MNRVCDAGGICGHTPQCDHFCHFTAAELEPEQDGQCKLCVDGCAACDARKQPQVRKIKPYPAIPDDIEPVPDQWHKIGVVMLWCIFAVLLVICLALFFTGLWVWSLLI